HGEGNQRECVMMGHSESLLRTVIKQAAYYPALDKDQQETKSFSFVLSQIGFTLSPCVALILY
ncbi:MAG: hypothetical protein ACRC9H_16365, partial [Aeromonas veronii]